MSSILKALKRIETQSSPPQSFPAWLKTTDPKGSLGSKNRQRRFFRRLITVSFILVVIGVAAVFLFSQRRIIISKKIPAGFSESKKEGTLTSTTKSNIFRAKIARVPAKRDQGPSSEAIQAKNPTLPAVPKSDVKEFRADSPSLTPGMDSGRRNSTTPPSVSSPQPTAVAKDKKSLKKKSPPQSISTPKKSVAAKSTPSDKPAPNTSTSGKTRTYDRLHDSKLKLQALAWFNDTSKRMAVINDRIIREGESVDGYKVIKIHQEGVVVHDGKKSWRLEFGLKQ